MRENMTRERKRRRSEAPLRLVMRQPDDWHVHLRDGEMMRRVLSFTARRFARAIVMPNLSPPIVSIAGATAYRRRILSALPKGARFTPLMTLYLTDRASPQELTEGYARGVFAAAKLYPAHATTNSALGVTDVGKLGRVFEAMARVGMPLLIHGEVTDPTVDVFDRERAFIERVLAPLIDAHPGLKIVLEHITTEEAAEFVLSSGPDLAATITPHHLVINRNAIFSGGLRPHMYCLPVAKRERHRIALRRAATSGGGKFFLGTDSAPHLRRAKESDCGCAGIFNAPAALEIYARVFEEESALDRLQAFAAENGPRFYGLALNSGYVALEKRPMRVARTIRVGAASVVPFHAGERLTWRYAGPATPTKNDEIRFIAKG
ncbi:MAG TPA: dihydroorotase [Alphaproteobacteria bacterium]|nr:dihydroorotase [Alphaproteobacteria bacterium]